MNRMRLLFVLGLLVASPATAGDGSMAVRDLVRAPPAFYQFCSADPGACRPVGPSISSIQLSAQRLAELTAVTRRVNRSVTETPDYKQFGREDVWSFPTSGRGDCEDYVLEKRRELIAAGWPTSVLLITVVRDERGDGHAVLTVVTDQGDLILDSRTDVIRRWSETPYTYYTRQAASDPRSFMAVVSPNPSAGGAVAAEASRNGKSAASAASAASGRGNGNAGGNANAGGNGNGSGNGNNNGAGNGNAGGNGNGSGNGNNNGAGNGNAGGNGNGSGNGNEGESNSNAGGNGKSGAGNGNGN